MFAVIKTGGKQYRVAPGDILTIEKLSGTNGDYFDFTEVLMLSDGKEAHIGAPTVEGAVVKGRLINQERADKIIVFKKKRRHNYRRKNGHRQYVTAVQIVEISAQGISEKAEKLIEPKGLRSTTEPNPKAPSRSAQQSAAPAEKKAQTPSTKASAAPKAVVQNPEQSEVSASEAKRSEPKSSAVKAKKPAANSAKE